MYVFIAFTPEINSKLNNTLKDISKRRFYVIKMLFIYYIIYVLYTLTL